MEGTSLSIPECQFPQCEFTFVRKEGNCTESSAQGSMNPVTEHAHGHIIIGPTRSLQKLPFTQYLHYIHEAHTFLRQAERLEPLQPNPWNFLGIMQDFFVTSSSSSQLLSH